MLNSVEFNLVMLRTDKLIYRGAPLLKIIFIVFNAKWVLECVMGHSKAEPALKIKNM